MDGSQRIARRWGILGAGLALAGGCAEVIGIEDWNKPIPSEGAGGEGAGGAPPACVVCAEAAPAGWSGPVAFRDTEGALDMCPDPWFTGVEWGIEPSTQDLTCSACGCQLDDAACVATSVMVYADAACPVGNVSFTPDIQCAEVVGLAATTYHGAIAATPTPNQPGCSTTGGEATASREPWSRRARACSVQLAQGSCAADEVCLPDTPSNHEVCVHRDGDQACPPGYPAKHTAYASADDTRTCPSCSCTAAGLTCAGSRTLLYASGDSSCGAPIEQIIHDNSCAPFSTDTESSVKAMFIPQLAGTCTPSTSPATGSVQPQDMLTVCCRTP
ncbi:MAG: hypothetical protein IT372_01665 [Polyangiaceae bacterium]|nr:hypothetical protein [Polyangiaceae bacterium]